MKSSIFRNNLITNIKTAIRTYNDSAMISDPGTRGDIREKAIDNIIKPLLPEGFSVEKNVKVIDKFGNQSRETDLIIYSKKLLPAVMYGEKDCFIPSEACMYAIEIKSTATAQNIKDAIKKATVLSKIRYGSGFFDEGRPAKHKVKRITPAFFAFDSDLTGDKMSELERYLKYHPGSSDAPLIPTICVVGRGCWSHVSRTKKWTFFESSKDHDEVIYFLSHMLNGLQIIVQSRGYPRIGTYVCLSEEGKIIE